MFSPSKFFFVLYSCYLISFCDGGIHKQGGLGGGISDDLLINNKRFVALNPILGRIIYEAHPS